MDFSIVLGFLLTDRDRGEVRAGGAGSSRRPLAGYREDLLYSIWACREAGVYVERRYGDVLKLGAYAVVALGFERLVVRPLA